MKKNIIIVALVMLCAGNALAASGSVPALHKKPDCRANPDSSKCQE